MSDLPHVDANNASTWGLVGLVGMWFAKRFFTTEAKELIELRLRTDAQAQQITELKVRLEAEVAARKEDAERREKAHRDLQARLEELTSAINDLNVELASLRRGRGLLESSDGGKR